MREEKPSDGKNVKEAPVNKMQTDSTADRILIMTSVEAEQTAILQGLGENSQSRFDVRLAGVGPVSAAARTAMILAKKKYKLVLNMGIAGGFPGVANIGNAVVATDIIAADLGAESPEGFKTIDQLGFGQSRWKCNEQLVEKITKAINKSSDVKAHAGQILTLSTVTGTSETVKILTEQNPEAAGEAMEGFGVATAAHYGEVDCLEIRTISNLVGPRERDAWRLDEALASLTIVSTILKEVL